MKIKQRTTMNFCTRLLVFSIAYWPLTAGAGEGEGEGEGEHEHKANEIAGYIGIAHEHSDFALALGLEYERRISSALGVGLLAEKTWGGIDSWVYAIPFTFHVDEWKYIIAPGIEDKHGHTENLLRVGVGLEIELNEMTVTPGFVVDFVGSETIVILGVSFGIGF